MKTPAPCTPGSREVPPGGRGLDGNALRILASFLTVIQGRAAEQRRSWRGRHDDVGSGLRPENGGKAFYTSILQHAQVCPLTARPMLSLTLLVRNLDWKTMYHSWNAIRYFHFE